MKLIFLFLTTLFVHSYASSYGQKVNITERNATLETVVKNLRQQTGYDFLLDKEVLQGDNKIDLSLRSVSLEQALERLSKEHNLQYTIKGKSVVITKGKSTTITPSFNNTVQQGLAGLVIDERGTPLIGATVKIKGGNLTTITDNKGFFRFEKLQAGDVLEISYVGYEVNETRVTNGQLAQKEYMIINMKLLLGNLEEVTIVNTGYQSLQRERSPGTIEHIGQDILSKRPATDLSSALDGIVAGMQAVQNSNGNNTFIIRGISTLDPANNQRAPLIVVDGFPLSSSDFSTINPNDVESVDVLKDAAAAAVWGARATNGVIVVTTKRGKGKQGFSIDGSAFARIAALPNLNQIMTTANSAQSIAYEKQAFANKFYSGSPYQGGVFPGELTRPLTLAQEFIFGNALHGMTEAYMNSSLDSLSRVNNHSQINQYLLQRTLTQQYNASLNANAERAKTYSSILFENNKGRYEGNGYKKFAFNFANEYKIVRFLTMNIGAFAQYIDTKNDGVTLSELRSLSPYETLVRTDGSYSPNINMYNRRILSQLPLNRFPYDDLDYNLLREVRGRDLESENFYARLQAGFSLKLIAGLTFDGKVQYERGKTDVSNYYNEDTFYVRQMINNFTAYNNTTQTVGRSLLPKGGINQSENNNITNYNYRGQLNFIRDINKFNINAVAGGEISQALSEGRRNPWLYGYNPATQTSIVPPYGYGSSVDTFVGSTITGGSTNSLNGGSTTLTYGLDRFVSYFGASNITYDKKYTLTLNIRGDASNYITDIPSLRWSPFWSIGGNWDVKSEKFMGKINWLNYLRLRASYGSTGTANKSTSTEALLNVSTAPDPSTGTIVASVSNYGNPYLRWERTYSTNIGVDFGMFANKLVGAINLYNKSGKDITGTVTLPAVYGTTNQTFNSADLVNKGFEIQLGTSLKLPANIQYKTSLNYAYNWNRITRLYYPNQFNYNLSIGSAFVEGKPINAFYTYNYVGVNDLGQPMIDGPNGSPMPLSGSLLYFFSDGLSDGYMNYAGTTTPPHTMGWRNSLSYKGFSLDIQLTGTFGGTFLNPTYNYGTYVGGSKTIVSRFVEQPLSGASDVIPFPSKSDTGAGVSSWQYYTPYLTHNIESSSYIQLKELMFNYQLPPSLIDRTRLSNINVFVQARDLGMIWNNNRHNYNPDFLPGTDRPLTTFTLGAKFGL